MRKLVLITWFLAMVIFASCAPKNKAEQNASATQWSKERARKWAEQVFPIKGANYLPRTAVNTTEMWQASTFDPDIIDQELSWAEQAGYNSMRVFLQYLVWENDPEGFKKRLHEFLSIANNHHIRIMLVTFDDCAFDAGRGPYLGKQAEPIPGVHNSRWTPSPGHERVKDRSTWPNLERYIKDLMREFGQDKRVLIWDLYNEPRVWRGSEYNSLPLVEAAFRWAREVGPSQPLTVGVAWGRRFYGGIQRIYELSDLLSFHGYGEPNDVREQIAICNIYHRPVLCTEWLFRQGGNTFDAILPIFAEEHIGWYHWGLVAGKTQTYLHWGSKKGDPTPEIWQHDVFHPDGTPYDKTEMDKVSAFVFL